MDDIIKNDLAHFYSYIPPHLCLPAPPSVGAACLPVGRGGLDGGQIIFQNFTDVPSFPSFLRSSRKWESVTIEMF
jgi:hypothetical protein